MATFRDLPSPVDELAEAVSLLIDQQPPDVLAEVDWRSLGIYLLPSLLDQLTDAVESSSSRGGAARSRQTVPASLDVLALLGSIDLRVGKGLRLSGYTGALNGDRTERIKRWASYAGAWRAKHPAYLYMSVSEARRWVTRAENILTPDPQIIETRAQPCPTCHQRTAMVRSDDLGEDVQRPSLYLDKATMIVHCRCCATQWAGPMHAWLCRVLEDRASTAR